MLAARLAFAFGLLAACGGPTAPGSGSSICDNVVPPPAACMTQCDPNPGAANTCPSGYHCAADGLCDAQCTPTGDECGDGFMCSSDGRCVGEQPCVGLQCNIVDCAAQGMPDTTIRGTVFAPNGTLPLYGITVYVPNAAVGPLADGAQCSRCADDLPGSPIVRATTDEAGNFTISGAPAGQNIPLVITSGKWRRQITLPAVNQCSDNVLQASQTSLPRNQSEGDIPRIAVTTGDWDSLECLIRKLGIDSAEITTGSGNGRVHLYTGNGVNQFDNGWPGGSGQNFSSATNLWNDVNKLKTYDIVILSCEGQQMGTNKSQTDLNAMKAYADLGGRVFASHWHNVWISGNYTGNGSPVIPAWQSVSTWGGDNASSTIDIIDEVNNPKGASFATWMLNVMGSTTRGQIQLVNGTQRSTARVLDNSKAERWTYMQGNMNPQNFQFTTPIESPTDQRCGKVVFSDMHVSGGPGSGDYPTSCGNSMTLTPQEKALAFMLFDLASCVGVIF